MLEVFIERGIVEKNEEDHVLTVTRNSLAVAESVDAERVGVVRQGEPGTSLEFDWQERRLGVKRSGEEGFEYRDLGRAYGASGWALWTSADFSQTTPLLLNGVTTLAFTPTPNLTYAPEGAESWFDGSRFRPPLAGQSFLLRLSLTALPLVAERELAVSLEVPGFFTVWGAQTELSRGAGVAQRVSFEPFFYVLGTLVNEGAVFRLETDGPLEVFDVSLLAVRLVE